MLLGQGLVTHRGVNTFDKKKFNDFKIKGIVREVRDGIVYVKGLGNGGMSRIVDFVGRNLKGMINYLDNKGIVGLTVLGNSEDVRVGDFVGLSKDLPKVKVGYGLLGRVVNSLGESVDGLGVIDATHNVLIENIAPGIISRQPVHESLETGLKFVDSMIPIGCGQRELIIGDPKTGKSMIALDTILNQKEKETICIYVAIGQKQTAVSKVYRTLKKYGNLENTVIVSATSSENAVMQYLAPFAGCAIGEYFMAENRKVVIIYDDLSKHAVAYRQMSLLLRRPPGREGYPGDVFFLHSRLLERAARLKDSLSDLNGGSMTALPIIETVDGDVSAFVPTNVISITDGQIYLESELFNDGIRPAISPGISVSRVGSAAQNKIIKSLSGPLKLDLAQYRELEQFAKLGMPVDSTVKYILEKGERLQQLMTQPSKSPVTMSTQILLLFSGLNKMLNDVSLTLIDDVERKSFFSLNHEQFDQTFNVMSSNYLLDDIDAFVLNSVKAHKVA